MLQFMLLLLEKSIFSLQFKIQRVHYFLYFLFESDSCDKSVSWKG